MVNAEKSEEEISAGVSSCILGNRKEIFKYLRERVVKKKD
jgi:hypothetical protein